MTDDHAEPVVTAVHTQAILENLINLEIPLFYWPKQKMNQESC